VVQITLGAARFWSEDGRQSCQSHKKSSFIDWSISYWAAATSFHFAFPCGAPFFETANDDGKPERASLAGKLSLSSSSSRRSAQCHSGLSGVGLLAEAFFRGAVVLADRDWLAGLLIGKRFVHVQVGNFDERLARSMSDIFTQNGPFYVRSMEAVDGCADFGP
jgi:hypothetical protein